MAADNEGVPTVIFEDDSVRIQIKLRVKPSLRGQLEEAARERGVTLNQEINYRLQRTFTDAIVVKDIDDKYQLLQQQVEQMDKQIHRLDETLRSLTGEEVGRDGERS